MRSIRRFALEVGATVTLATAFAATWIAVTGTYRPPMWVNFVAGPAVVGVAWAVESALTARTRPRRRAHARPGPPKTRGTT